VPKKLIFLNVFLMRLPLTAIVSILHRISGVLLFLFMPVILYFFQQSLLSQETFDLMKYYLSKGSIRLVIFCVVSLFLYHLIAGVRHIMMDYGIGEGHRSGLMGSRVVLFTFILISLVIGVCLW